jgi:hypothetical protein
MSSNATEKYAVDALMALSSPTGFVHHLRYQLRLLDQDLRNMLKPKGEPVVDTLQDIRTVLCYLYQIRRSDRWDWISVYPFRLGVLVDAYKTGNNDNDIAHLYIRVDNYVLYSDLDYNQTIRDMIGEKYGTCYASLGSVLNANYIAKRGESKQAFHRICESLKIEHFRSRANEDYYPVFSFVEGFRDENGKVQELKYDRSTYKAYYEIREGSRYAFDFGIYFPEQPPEFTMSLKSDDKVFATPDQYTTKVLSRYDEESWLLVSRLVDSDIWTAVSFDSHLNIGNKIPLNLSLTFPVLVKQKIIYGLLEVLSDLGFAVGTASLALSKFFETWTWWYWPVGIGYGLWFVFRLVIKLRRR